MDGHANALLGGRGRGIPRGLSLCGHFGAAAPTGSHFETYQERALLRIVSGRRLRAESRASRGCGRTVASLLGM
jgi:hypothetical protein